MKLKNLTNEQINNILATIDNDGFWYALSVGGYLAPEDILENKEDISMVNQAVAVLFDLEDLIDKLEVE